MSKENRGKHADRQSDNQRDRKTLDLLGPNVIQNQGTDERREVRVENGRPSTIETVADRHARRRVLFSLFPDPFKN